MPIIENPIWGERKIPQLGERFVPLWLGIRLLNCLEMISPVARADDSDAAAKEFRIQRVGAGSEERKGNGICDRDYA